MVDLKMRERLKDFIMVVSNVGGRQRRAEWAAIQDWNVGGRQGADGWSLKMRERLKDFIRVVSIVGWRQRRAEWTAIQDWNVGGQQRITTIQRFRFWRETFRRERISDRWVSIQDWNVGGRQRITAIQNLGFGRRRLGGQEVMTVVKNKKNKK